MATVLTLAGTGCSKSDSPVVPDAAPSLPTPAIDGAAGPEAPAMDGAASLDRPAIDGVTPEDAGGAEGGRGLDGPIGPEIFAPMGDASSEHGEVLVQPDAMAPIGTPILTVVPTSMTFVPTMVGNISDASTVTVTVANGPATVMPTVIGDFVIDSSTCVGPVTASCSISVKFGPSSAGSKSGLLTIRDGMTVSLSGVGTQPELTVTPSTLDFGPTRVGLPTGPRTFTVTNAGETSTAALVVEKQDAASSVGGAARFTYTTTCPAVLAPGASCQVVITYAPTLAGSDVATITVSDGTKSSPAATVAGKGVMEVNSSTPCSTLDFGRVVVGESSTPVVCALSYNFPSSTNESAVISLNITGDFAISQNGCSEPLPPYQTCTFYISFRPTAKGTREGSLAMSSSTGYAFNQALGGVGLGRIEIVEFEGCSAGKCDPSASDPTASNVAVQPFDFGRTTVGKTSNTDLTLAVFVRAPVGTLSLQTAFGTPSEFVLGSGASLGTDCDTYATNPTPTTGISLEKPLCYKTVRFAPVSRASVNGSVTVVGANSASDSCFVKGTGDGPLVISPSALTFSTVAVGTASATQTLTISNDGLVGLGAMSYVLAGSNANEFKVVTDNLTGTTLPPGGSATIGVQSGPTSAGGKVATITVSGTRADSAAYEGKATSLLATAVAP